VKFGGLDAELRMVACLIVIGACCVEAIKQTNSPISFLTNRFAASPAVLGGLWSAPVLWRYSLLPGETALSVKAVVLK